METIAGILTSIDLAELIWSGLSAIGVAAIISAYTHSKSKHANPLIRVIDQTARDLLSIIAFNINKAKNADDDRPQA